VLQDVSFEVPRGCGFVILGRSGTGKSVTLKHIIGLIRPDSGRVFVEDDEIPVLKGRELSRARRKMGFLFQSAALFDSISVGENVAFLRRHTALKDARSQPSGREARRRTCKECDKCQRSYPACETRRSRAGVALDPPVARRRTERFDPVTADEIDDLLLGLKEDGHTTLVVVTHNIPSARRLGDQLVMLHDGRVVARGTPREFERSDDPLVRAFMTSHHAG
jgi:phospholipid/cholesterol/gamma-HCH transport system ATP-binding protein